MKLSAPILAAILTISASGQAFAAASARDWQALNVEVGGRLLKGVPFSSPCFSNLDGLAVTPNIAACDSARAGYDDEREFQVYFFSPHISLSRSPSCAKQCFRRIYDHTVGDMPALSPAVSSRLSCPRKPYALASLRNMPHR